MSDFVDHVPRQFRAPIVVVLGTFSLVASVLVGQSWIEERINSKVDARAAIIATAVMGKMQERLTQQVSQAARDGANEAVNARVAPLEQRVARVEGWVESRQGRVEVAPR